MSTLQKAIRINPIFTPFFPRLSDSFAAFDVTKVTGVTEVTKLTRNFFMDYFERIVQVAELKGLTITSFFNDAGFSHANFANSKARKGVLSERILRGLKRAHPDINLDYIKDGVGEPLLSDAERSTGVAINQVAHGNRIAQKVTVKKDPCAELRATVAHLQAQNLLLQESVADKTALIAMLKKQLGEG